MKTLLDNPKFETARNHFADACKFSRLHSDFAAAQLRVFGSHGPAISGCVREHFPEDRKNTLRASLRGLSRLATVRASMGHNRRLPQS